MSADGRSIFTAAGIYESGAWMHDAAHGRDERPDRGRDPPRADAAERVPDAAHVDVHARGHCAHLWQHAFLWIFGDNIEDRLGRGRFVVFYLVCGVVAALGQGLADPRSEVPMIGAPAASSARHSLSGVWPPN